MKTTTFSALGLLLIASTALASTPSPYPINNVVDVAVDRANNDLKIVANVLYPNGCYRPDQTSVNIDQTSHNIEISHSADVVPGICPQAIVLRYPVVELSKPADGTYRLIDQSTNRLLGKLTIKDSSVDYRKVSDDFSRSSSEGG